MSSLIKSKKIAKVIGLRDTRNIDSNKIINYPLYELIELCLKQIIGKNSFTTNRLPHWRDERFAQKVAKNISADCLGVFGFPNNLLESFKVVSENSMKIIEQPIGHILVAQKIFDEEKYLNPEFADSITFSDTDPKFLDRITEEHHLANKICVPSNFVKETMVESGVDESKITTNAYGSFLTPTDSIYHNHDKELTVLFVGQLTQRKGIKYLLEAVKVLKRDGVRVKLILVGQIFGSGSWFSKYRDCVDEYYGSVPRNHLKEIYCRSDLFILPSLFEGSALVVYEALSHGIPCIVTPNTGADSIIDDVNGYVVPLRNSHTIIEKVHLLNQDRYKLDNLKQNALETSRNLSWTNYRERLKNIVKSI